MSGTARADARARLAAAGASAAEIARWEADGIAPAQAWAAVADRGLRRVLHRLRAEAPSARERTRLAALRALAEAAAELHPPGQRALFWQGASRWLGGDSPAQALAGRGGMAAVADLIHRLRHGLYS